jgi:hypothetical protein
MSALASIPDSSRTLREVRKVPNPDIKDANHKKRKPLESGLSTNQGEFEQRCAHHLIFIAQRRGVIRSGYLEDFVS